MEVKVLDVEYKALEEEDKVSTKVVMGSLILV